MSGQGVRSQGKYGRSGKKMKKISDSAKIIFRQSGVFKFGNILVEHVPKPTPYESFRSCHRKTNFKKIPVRFLSQNQCFYTKFSSRKQCCFMLVLYSIKHYFYPLFYTV